MYELSMIKIVHWESKWCSHNNRLCSGSLVRNSFFWLNESKLWKKMLHWYMDTMKSSTSVPVFLIDCEKTDDRHLHELILLSLSGNRYCCEIISPQYIIHSLSLQYWRWWHVTPFIQPRSRYSISAHMFRRCLTLHGGNKYGKSTSC